MSRKELTAFRAERVGFVFQSANLVPFLTARENLLFVSSLVKGISKKQAQKRADDLLGELGLADRAKNLPEQLSGGERQRVAIGRALMNDPDLVLVDEPTAALDTAMGRQVVQLLRREIKSRGKTGIMVTHDLRMVEYTDRVFEILDATSPTSSSPAPWRTDLRVGVSADAIHEPRKGPSADAETRASRCHDTRCGNSGAPPASIAGATLSLISSRAPASQNCAARSPPPTSQMSAPSAAERMRGIASATGPETGGPPPPAGTGSRRLLNTKVVRSPCRTRHFSGWARMSSASRTHSYVVEPITATGASGAH